MYRALYRKWRPARFEDVVGQDSITEALKNQIIHEKVGHAYMFTGTRGTGKTTCAKIFAKAVNCENPQDGDPCCECPTCRGIENGSILDVVEIDAASNNSVDNIRDLRDETAYTPSSAHYKVYIIDEVHMLSTAAFNALLKIMEEPPPHIIFILATTEIHKVPATILSRCQRYDFMRIAPEHIQKRISYVAQQEGIELSQEAATLIARLADGAMRDALSILDTCAGVTNQVDDAVVRRMAGVTDKAYLFSISEAVSEQDAAKALLLVAQLREKSIDVKRLCDELILHYRNLLLAGIDPSGALLPGVSAEDESRYLATAGIVSQHACIRAIRVLSEALDKMGKGTDARIDLELALFSLCEPENVSAAAPAPQPVRTMPQQPSFYPEAPAIKTFASAPVAVQPVSVSQPSPAPVAPPPKAETSAPAVSPQPVSAVAAAPVAQPQAAHSTPAQDDAAQKQAEPFAPWGEVCRRMAEKDRLLYTYLSKSKAYFDGRRVLIDGSELFLEYMRTNRYSAELIKSTIAEVTGKRCGIGPYQHSKEQIVTEQSAEQNLELLRAQGVDVIIEEEQKENDLL